MVPQPPVAPTRPYAREFFGDVVQDPYFWMKDRQDPQFLAYIEAENEYAMAMTADVEDLAQTLFHEIRGRVQESDLSVPVRHGDYWYYSRTIEGEQYSVDGRLRAADHPQRPVITDGAAPDGEQVVLDQNADADGLDYYGVGAAEIDPSARLLAYGVDLAGDERYDVRVKDIDSGEILDDAVRQVGYDLAWSLDSRFLFYTRVDEAWRTHQVWRHEVGTPVEQDVLILHEDDELFTVGVGSSKDERHILIAINSTSTTEWHLLDAADPTGPWQCIAPRAKGVEYAVEAAGDRLLIVHNMGRTNFELAQAPLDATSAQQWEPVSATDSQEYLLGVAAFEGFVVVALRHDGLRALRILPRDVSSPNGFGQPWNIDLSEDLGVLSLGSNPDSTASALLVEFSSLVTPATTFEYDLATRQALVLKRQPVLGGYDPANYVQRREWAMAQDGTRVPISLVHKADVQPDGTAGCLVYGYGSYGASIEPSFRMASRALSLLERGYVFAIAHIRGGSEMGRAWYENGRLEHKMNTFTDFVDCGRHLVESGWSAPDRLAAMGGSAGGLLMGAVANLAPERFAFIHAAVPFVDALTTILDETLPLTVGEWEEWGDAPHDEAAYRLMKSYSPYENLRETAYPAILVTTNINDTRVFVTEPAKWVARLRQTALVDSQRNPVLFRTETKPSSHAGQSGRYDAWRQLAWETAVLLRYTGGID